MIIAIDFDGTCVTHEYPRIGVDIGAWPVIKELGLNGHDIILLTMRSGNELDEAVELFNKHSIQLYGINHNPTQHRWTTSPKVYAQLYIDDAALGCPLVRCEGRPFANWEAIRKILVEEGCITKGSVDEDNS